MADKLTYKGGSKVVGSSGTMKLVLPKGGGDFHRVPRWWGIKGTVAYVDAAIFKVPLDNGEMVRLVLPGVKSHMTVEIRHDGSGTFTFPKEGGIERVAVVSSDSLDIIHEYQFAKISGGSVLKRTIGNLPEPPAPRLAPHGDDMSRAPATCRRRTASRTAALVARQPQLSSSRQRFVVGARHRFEPQYPPAARRGRPA